jgi:hypothetical protein
MKRLAASSCFGLVLGVACLGVTGQPALAVGYWNLPGNFCQCFGYGWGPGYHASMVLGPPSCDGIFAHDVVRLPAAPSPAGWSAVQGHGYAPPPMFDRPSVLSPGPQPAAAPSPGAYRGPIFR